MSPFEHRLGRAARGWLRHVELAVDVAAVALFAAWAAWVHWQETRRARRWKP